MPAVDLVCIDVDGTLLDSKGQIPKEVWRAARRLRERGVHLALCSGRPAFGVSLEYAQQLDAEGWHIFQNGASIVRPLTGETRSSPLSPAIVQRLIERARATNRPLELYTDHEMAVELDDDRARRHADLLGVPYRPRPYSTLEDPIVRAQWLLAHRDRAPVLAEAHEGLTLCPSLAPLMPDTTFMNMTAAGVDKGSALRSVAKAYGVPLERVMMVGDSANDLPALRVAGVSVAMGNAEASVIETARFAVGHVDDGGLSEALAWADQD